MSGQKLQDVTVVVVSFNTREKLKRCLSAIGPNVATIVVDNASGDGSADMVATEFSYVTLIRNTENRGFGAANNQGLAIAKTELVLLLNSDAYAETGAIEQLANVMTDERIIAVGGKLIHTDGRLQESACNELTLWAVFCEQYLLEKLAPWSKFLSPYWVSRWHQDKPTEVAQVMGAALMMRNRARFDERYFLYCEDTDLCKRLSPLGKIFYVPSAVFVHDLGSSSSSPARAIALYNRGKELYFEIHRGKFAAWMCFWIDRKGAALRLLIWLIPTLLTLGLWGKTRQKVGVFWRVMTGPKAGPPAPTGTHP